MQNNQKIPEGWSVKRLRECLEIKHGKPQHDIEDPHGLYPILASGGQIGRTNSFLCSEPSVLIGRKGTIDKPQYMETPFWTVDTLFYSHIKSGYMAKYLFYKFQTINWNKYNEGSTIPSLSSSTIHSIKVLLPPLQEQEKIAGILGTWDEAIEKLSSLIEQKKNLKKGLMQRLLTGKTRLPGFTQPWKEVKLGNLCTMFSGGTPSVLEEDYYKNGDIPFIRSGEISSSETALFITEKGLKNSSAKMIEKGDLLYALYGATSGETAISKINGAINQAILCIRSTKIEILYLYYVLLNNKSIILSKYLQGGQGNLSADIVKKLSIKMPSNIAEQKAIADVLSTADDEINLLNQKLETLKEQKKGLMQQLLTGQTRVKVN